MSRAHSESVDAARAPLSLAALRLDHFSALIGEHFALCDGATPLTLQLDSAESLGEAPPGSARKPFSLVFRGEDSLALAQGTYALEQPRLGRLEIFLVPLASREGESRYQAVFS